MAIADADAETRSISISSSQEPPPEPHDVVLAEAAPVQRRSAKATTGPFDLPQLAPGDVVGRYTVLDLLGRGGMGTVYKAYDPQLDRNVAVKLLRRVHSSGGRSERQLLREAQMLARLQHPNVVAVFDAGLTERGVFIAMELCEGRTLRKWLEGRRTASEILAVFLAAGRGLAAVHQAGFVHRDFKPSNVLVGHDGSVRVLDFGIASLMDPASVGDEPPSSSLREVARPPGVSEALDPSSTGVWSMDDGIVVGTPLYMAPEQVMGQRADHRSEQFTFCACLHVALYGCSPVVGDTFEARREAIEAGRVIDERELLTGPTTGPVPARVRRALLRGLSVDPAGRFPSMQALLHELEPAARRWPLVVAGVVIAASAAAAAMILVEHRDPCTNVAAALEGVWSADDRKAVQAAFVRSGHPEASALHEHAQHQLDRYATAFTEMSAESCRATFVTRQQSELLHDHRMRCLKRRRDRMRAAIDALVAIDEPQQAMDRTVLPFVLPSLSECADLDAVTAYSPLPPEPAARERIAELRRRLDEAQTLQAAGEFKKGLVLARAVVEQAREAGFPPVLAEALSSLGSLQAVGGSAREAQATLEAAIREAARAKDDVTAAKSWTWLLYALLVQRELDEGLSLELAAQAAVDRADDDEVRGWLLNNLGALYSERGDFPRARRYLEESLEIKARTLGPGHVDVGISWANLGRVLVDHRFHADARDAFERARAVFESTVGPAHPHTHYAVGGLCLVEVAEGRYARAVELCARLLRHFETSPSSDVIMGNSRFLMAKALHGAGRGEEAWLHARIALELVWAEAPTMAREIAAWMEAPPGLLSVAERRAREREGRGR